MEDDLQFIILGTGNEKYEELFRKLASSYPDKIAANIRYDATIAQKIYAGSDMFLMPSKYEPCGLSQLFSLRYGTIPIVRETGGLKDTIQSYNELTGEGNGFSFTEVDAQEMLAAIRKAISYYQQEDIWTELVKKAMQSDFSWENSAKEYISLYFRAVAKK